MDWESDNRGSKCRPMNSSVHNAKLQSNSNLASILITQYGVQIAKS